MAVTIQNALHCIVTCCNIVGGYQPLVWFYCHVTALSASSLWHSRSMQLVLPCSCPWHIPEDCILNSGIFFYQFYGLCFYILPVRCFLKYWHVYFQVLPVNVMVEILVNIMVAAKKTHLGIFVVSAKEDIQVWHLFCM